MSKPNPYADLPAVVAITGISDAGEFGAAHCPHCGAEGRIIYHFLCDDGSHRAAMRGCFKKFPKPPLTHRAGEYDAKKHEALLEKRRAAESKDEQLAKHDEMALTAYQQFGSGEIDEWELWKQLSASYEEAQRARKARQQARRHF